MKKLVFFYFFFHFSLQASDNDLEKYLWQQNIDAQLHESQHHFQNLKRKVKNKEIKGLELIIASEKLRLGSQFGHSMLRFVDSDQDMGNDVILNMTAILDSPKINPIKGLLGVYSLRPLYTSFRKTLYRYHLIEERNLERFIIPLNDKLRSRLFDQLLNWETESQLLKTGAFQKALEKAYDKYPSEKYTLKKEDDTLLAYEGLYKGPMSDFSLAIKKQAYDKAFSKLKKNLSKGEHYVFITNHEIFIPKDSRAITYIPFSSSQNYKPFFEKYSSSPLFKGYPYEFYSHGILKEKGLAILPKDEELEYQKKIFFTPKITPIISKNDSLESLGDYKFLSQNCAAKLVDLFKDIGVPIGKFKWFSGRIPEKLPLYLSKNMLIPYPSLKIDSYTKLIENLSSLKNLTVREKLMLIKAKNPHADKNWRSTYKEYFKLIDRSVEALYEIEKIDLEIYQLCETNSCIKNVKNILKKTWTAEEILKAKDIFGPQQRSRKRYSKNSDLLRHYTLLEYFKN